MPGSVERILLLLQSSRTTERLEAYLRMMEVPDAAMPFLALQLGDLAPPDVEPEASIYWEASNYVTRRCLLASPGPATRHVASMNEVERVAVTQLLLSRPDGSERETEFLVALLPTRH